MSSEWYLILCIQMGNGLTLAIEVCLGSGLLGSGPASVAVYADSLGAHRKKDDDEPSPSPRMATVYNLYWCMHSCSVTIAFGVSAMYWGFIYNPESHELDIPNFAAHLFNSVFMGTDFIISGHPFELVHAIYPLIFVSAYVVFNFFYYMCGGLSRKGTVTLYEAMDWRNPVSCLKFVGGGYVVVTSVHIFLFLAYIVKRRVALCLKWRQYRRENHQAPAQDNTVV